MVLFSFLSAVGYACHATMGWMVYKNMKFKRERGVVEVEAPEDLEARKKKAHELWVRMTNMEGL